ncbi:hypothetical protein MIMGU_mgv1a022400mg [Erythranthe guttata]|uniref:Myb-like domain-containing protein n=1 Tax=Erythranthe guttata TaxID=4155 RepID=A0A022REI1_ERYGU|nr:PREDICTED: trihelix transcription factor PTL-like [Erythranthe guttata]EYU38616.1 hypothetical protein MIMGU_mgv1a022400mg [Erythranthe guttata]|eukprot:XP_012836100.1 PREDICTED: trihelix transcription factor PTL-like [Erythranthe guttata]
MEDQYGMADLRQYITGGRPYFPAVSRQPDFLQSSHHHHRGLISPHPYDMLMFGSDHPNIVLNASAGGGEPSSAAAARGLSVSFEMDAAGGAIGGGDGGCTARWPRQETLALLEIRSNLDSKFKEANQKGPLWDEIARIMCEEHGYQRSGKKCREKFENLYKYYKKTKEGKSGKRQGKHYRFFRQLEALYGDQTASNNNNYNNNNNNNNNNNYSASVISGTNYDRCNYPLANNSNYQEASCLVPKLSAETSHVSFSNCSSDSNTSSSDDESDTNNPRKNKKMKKRGGKRDLKAKIKESIEAQMKKLMEKQEAWMEKMMNTIEHKDQERIMREEQWRKQDSDRIEREHKFWAGERAWMEARDAALMDAFNKFTRKEFTRADNSPSGNYNSNNIIWPESEITRLIQLRNEMESRFQQCRINGSNSDGMLWEEIAAKMGCFGNEQKSASMCREKWDSVNDYLIKCNKKKLRRENINTTTKGGSSCMYYHDDTDNQSIVCNQGLGGLLAYSSCDAISTEPQLSNSTAVNDTCLRYFFGDGYGRS